MSQYGSSLYTVKSTLTTLLSAAVTNTNVSYQSPNTQSDLKNQDGELDAIWIEDATASESIALVSGLPARLDEEYDVTLILQSLRAREGDTQADADMKATQMLGDVLKTIVDDPSLGVGQQTDFLLFTCLPVGWKHKSGGLPSGKGFGARYELDLHVHARIQLT